MNPPDVQSVSARHANQSATEWSVSMEESRGVTDVTRASAIIHARSDGRFAALDSLRKTEAHNAL